MFQKSLAIMNLILRIFFFILAQQVIQCLPQQEGFTFIQTFGWQLPEMLTDNLEFVPADRQSELRDYTLRGFKDGQVLIAKRLKAFGMSNDEIMKATGLSENELHQIE